MRLELDVGCAITAQKPSFHVHVGWQPERDVFDIFCVLQKSWMNHTQEVKAKSRIHSSDLYASIKAASPFDSECLSRSILHHRVRGTQPRRGTNTLRADDKLHPVQATYICTIVTWVQA